jgi:rubredoxin
MSKDWWRCNVCRYIYKPEVGDAVAKVVSGTSFENLPNDWVCPVCFSDKDVFFPFQSIEDE